MFHLAGGFTPSTLLRASPAQDHHGAVPRSTAFLEEAADGKLPADLSALAQGGSGFFLQGGFTAGTGEAPGHSWDCYVLSQLTIHGMQSLGNQGPRDG